MAQFQERSQLIVLSQNQGSKLISECSSKFHSRFRFSSRQFDIRIAHIRIRVFVSSKEMWQIIYPALSWQAEESTMEPDIEIYVLAGGKEVESPWELNDFLDGNRIRGFDTGNVLASFDTKHSILNIYDRSMKKGVFWIESTQRVPEWEIGAPLRQILKWALFDYGIHLIHSAGIGIQGKGVLLLGPGGTGKSTTTSICLENGFRSAGDDYCAFSIGESPRVFGVYGFLKLVPGKLGTSWLHDKTTLGKRSDGKLHYEISDFLAKSFTLKSIIFLRLSDLTRSPRLLAQMEIFTRLISCIFDSNFYREQEQLELIKEISKKIKAYELEVGWEISMIPPNLESLCQD